jgi:hypothetical protein
MKKPKITQLNTCHLYLDGFGAAMEENGDEYMHKLLSIIHLF